MSQTYHKTYAVAGSYGSATKPNEDSQSELSSTVHKIQVLVGSITSALKPNEEHNLSLALQFLDRKHHRSFYLTEILRFGSMASSSSLAESSSFDSRGSASLNDDSSPEGFSVAYLVEERAAPIYPLNSDVFPELAYDRKGELVFPVLCDPPRLGDRHVFLCFKVPEVWPAAASNRLPRFLGSAIKNKQSQMIRNTHLILCEGRDGTETSNGDVMIFPDMVRYRGLTHFDVDAFVEEVLVHGREWLPGRPEKLFGTHIFVCAHGFRDSELGVSGPLLVKIIKQYSATKSGSVSVKPCSFIQDYNKQSGNVVAYSANGSGEVSGCCSYVTLDTIHSVLEDLDKRGFFDIRKDSELEHVTNAVVPQPEAPLSTTANGCYHANEINFVENHEALQVNGDVYPQLQGYKTTGTKNECGFVRARRLYSSSKWYQASWWFNFWEKEDTLAAFTVVGAAISVALACRVYRTQMLN